MKKTIRMTAAALAAITAISCAGFTASADRIKTIDGIAYRYSDSGEKIGAYTGWIKTADGKKYVKNGNYVTEKWITKKNGARFYLGADGITETGWTHIGTDWYYIDEKKGALTGAQTIGGIAYTFDSKGKWDKTAAEGVTDWYKAYKKLTKKLDKKKYGIIMYMDEMCLVTSINGQAEADVAKLFPNGANVVFTKADYSCYEMEKIREDLLENHRDCWTGLGIMNDGLLHIEYKAEQKAALDEYMSGLDNAGCIVATLTDGVFYDD